MDVLGDAARHTARFRYFSLEAWPILQVSCEGIGPRGDFAVFLDEMEWVLARGQPCLAVVEAYGTRPISFSQMLAQVHSLRRGGQSIRLCKGLAIVMDSQPGRSLMTAVLRLQAVPCPVAVFPTSEEAWSWVVQQGRVAGLLDGPPARGGETVAAAAEIDPRFR